MEFTCYKINNLVVMIVQVKGDMDATRKRYLMTIYISVYTFHFLGSVQIEIGSIFQISFTMLGRLGQQSTQTRFSPFCYSGSTNRCTTETV